MIQFLNQSIPVWLGLAMVAISYGVGSLITYLTLAKEPIAIVKALREAKDAGELQDVKEQADED